MNFLTSHVVRHARMQNAFRTRAMRSTCVLSCSERVQLRTRTIVARASARDCTLATLTGNNFRSSSRNALALSRRITMRPRSTRSTSFD